MAKPPKPDIKELQKLGLEELQTQYKALFPERPAPFNLKYLFRQIAQKLQDQAMGGLSKEAQAKINELISTYDPSNKRTFKTRAGNISTSNGRDPRLPMPGSMITKIYKNNRIEVKVLEAGFECRGTTYKNLSAVAEAITGNHWNGFVFFGLHRHGRR